MAEREKQEEQLGAAVCWQILNNWSPHPAPPPTKKKKKKKHPSKSNIIPN